MGKRAALIGAILLGSIACGGGGGGNDGGDVGGNWTGALTLIRNDCNLSLPTTLSFQHSVSQNGDAVILVDADGVQYLGNVVGDNGFSVDALTADNQPFDSLTCDTSERIAYDGIDDDNDGSIDDISDESDEDNDPNTATVKFTIMRTCNNNTLCETEYRGTARRGGVAVPLPTANPNPTPTPDPNAREDCEFLTERTYSGDSGCGLASTRVNVMTGAGAPVVVLEPFGVNGATSFIQDATNPINAQSTRTDLTINGMAGYRCSLECTAPITFDVECFREGGTSCKERF